MPNLPELQKISQISPDQSVICITGENGLPEWLKLSKPEKEFALKQLQAGEEYVVINSYFRVTCIVRVKENLPEYRQKEELRKTAYNLRKIIKSNNHQELVIAPHKAFIGAAGAFTEGLLLSFYSFDKYKTVIDDREKTANPSKLLLYEGPDDEELKWLIDLTESVWLIRDLINEPVSHLNAPALAEEIKKAGEESGFTVEVLTRGRIEALKMGGLLAVNRGSVDPPVFCILEWKPEKALNKEPVVLVGKGIVYDTGGLNIKPGDYMENMKGDMAGAAAVTGAMRTIAKAGLPIHVVGLVPATDNRPGGNAYTQGEIITMYNKMTVEVGNTDAEGRLILADAISYASKYKPELIIDVATLTGSAAMAFGIQGIAVMGNADRKYFRLLEECGNEVYERLAEMPFWDEYGELIKSDIADVRNIGGREAGAITAGKFLERFAEYPLIHLDIAGPGLLKKDDYYRIKEGPGTGARLLSEFLRRYAGSLLKKNQG